MDIEEEVVEFHWLVLMARKRNDYRLSHIMNMNETPMWYELPATRTFQLTGNQPIGADFVVRGKK